VASLSKVPGVAMASFHPRPTQIRARVNQQQRTAGLEAGQLGMVRFGLGYFYLIAGFQLTEN
jgi:hypothetical protein